MKYVALYSGACNGAEVAISPEGAEAVRMSFNPSGLEPVNRIKSLTAALVSELIAQLDSKPNAAREFDFAIANVQTASMWAVLAATKGATP